MKKRTKTGWIILAAVLAAAVILAIIWGTAKDKSKGLQAMYVPYGEGSYVMIEQTNGNVFTVPDYEKILDLEKNEIEMSDLQKGDILDIYGSGIMAESYPGQYMGVTEMRLVKRGVPSDADRYQDIIDSIYTPAEPNEKPTLSLDYATELARVSVAAQNSSYSWTWEENGQSKSEDVDGVHPLQMKKENIADVIVSEPVDITLSFSSLPQTVKVTKWPLSELGTDADSDGEAVKADGSGTEGWTLNSLEPGYLYSVEGTWEQGSVRYEFYLEKK
ncbi:MAG: hypothetical protein PHR92_15805 [Lachnospiraceae bacterium]|nr:hypothetical protein [Lachnospiraceae bacterium]